jgi:uncharacterized protein DUF4214
MTKHGDHAMTTLQQVPMNAAKDLAALVSYHGANFVRCAYLTLVNREPDETGMDFYLGRLLEGASKVQILSEMHGSPEAKEKGVNLPGLERAIFLRMLATRPLIGPVLCFLLRIEGDSVLQTRLRRIEQHVIALYHEGGLGGVAAFRPDRNALLSRRVVISAADPAAVMNQFREAVSDTSQAHILANKRSA